MNLELNAFLALLEDRPETFRDLLRGQKRSSATSTQLATIQGRIRQAVLNIKCQAAKETITDILSHTLRIQPGNLLDGVDSTEDAFYMGVVAVEEAIATLLESLVEEEKSLGPSHTAVPRGT